MYERPDDLTAAARVSNPRTRWGCRIFWNSIRLVASSAGSPPAQGETPRSRLGPPRSPAKAREGHASLRIQRDPLVQQQLTLQELKAALRTGANLAPRVHDAVPGDARVARSRKRIADPPRPAGQAHEFSNLAVGGYAPMWNAGDYPVDSLVHAQRTRARRGPLSRRARATLLEVGEAFPRRLAPSTPRPVAPSGGHSPEGSRILARLTKTPVPRRARCARPLAGAPSRCGSSTPRSAHSTLARGEKGPGSQRRPIQDAIQSLSPGDV